MVESTLSRERVLAAASELFYQYGIAAVGMDAIRDRAGVALKTIYGEFGSKEGVVTAYLAGRDESWLAWLLRYLDGVGDDPHQRVLGIFDALDTWFSASDFAGCAFINAFGEVAGTGQVAAHAARHKERLAQLVLELTTSIDPARAESLADELMVLIEGAIVRASLGHRSDAARTARALAKLVLRDADALMR